MRGKRQAPALYSGKDPVPIVYEAGWAVGPVWTGAEDLSYTVNRSPDRPSRNESLYRLSYQKPEHHYCLSSCHMQFRTLVNNAVTVLWCSYCILLTTNTHYSPAHSPRCKQSRSGAGRQEGDPHEQTVRDVLMAAVVVRLWWGQLSHSEKEEQL